MYVCVKPQVSAHSALCGVVVVFAVVGYIRWLYPLVISVGYIRWPPLSAPLSGKCFITWRRSPRPLRWLSSGQPP